MSYSGTVTFQIATEQEADGRWLAEVEALPGVVAYGTSRVDAVAKVQAVALRVSLLSASIMARPFPSFSASPFMPREHVGLR